MDEETIENLAQKIVDTLFQEGYVVSQMTFEAAKHFVRDNEISRPN